MRKITTEAAKMKGEIYHETPKIEPRGLIRGQRQLSQGAYMVKPVFSAAREPRFGGGLIVRKDVPPRIQRSTDWVGRNPLVLGGARMNAISQIVRGNGVSTG